MATNYDGQASTNYKEAFSLFDKRGNGRVTLDSLGDLLRACGQNPTLSEIRDLEKNVGNDCELQFYVYMPASVPESSARFGGFKHDNPQWRTGRE